MDAHTHPNGNFSPSSADINTYIDHILLTGKPQTLNIYARRLEDCVPTLKEYSFQEILQYTVFLGLKDVDLKKMNEAAKIINK
ncbi:hypothetical protein [Candidatus Uabimicrobium sp. HlEnr_7]|uniref:hypothetical protein n=1 Tax=Candidatus Uabimicrobium helgolandensis TaxID=3095367 RepID=UPI003558CFA6